MLVTASGPRVFYRPDYKYRYLSEDIPCGLCVCKGVAELLGVPTPEMDLVIAWAQVG